MDTMMPLIELGVAFAMGMVARLIHNKLVDKRDLVTYVKEEETGIFYKKGM